MPGNANENTSSQILIGVFSVFSHRNSINDWCNSSTKVLVSTDRKNELILVGLGNLTSLLQVKSSCLSVFTYSLHHCFETVTSFVSDCILSSYWLLSKSSSQLFNWHWGHIQAIQLHLHWSYICLWFRQSWATYYSSCNLNCYWLAVMPRTSCVRFFVCGQ